MEMSHQSHILKAQFAMLCDQGYYTSRVRGYCKNDLVFIYTFDNKIRYNFVGKSQHSIDNFKIQKRIIWNMTKSRNRDSCRQLFRRIEILPLQFQYIFSVLLLLFVVKNKDLYITNLEIHNFTTRLNINPPGCNLTVVQKGAHYSGIKLFNKLPLKIKSLTKDIKLFKPALKRFHNLKFILYIG